MNKTNNWSQKSLSFCSKKFIILSTSSTWLFYLWFLKSKQRTQLAKTKPSPSMETKNKTKW